MRLTFSLATMLTLAVSGLAHGEELPPPPPPQPASPSEPTESSVADCTDGIDNDGDGTIDCADKDCRYVFQCSKAARRTRNDARRSQVPLTPPTVETVEPDAEPKVAPAAQLSHKEENVLPETTTPVLPRLISESDLPSVDRSGGSGRSEIILSSIALPAGFALILGGIPSWVEFGGSRDGTILKTGALLTVFGTGVIVAGSLVLYNGLHKRDAYRKTERLLRQLGAVPLPSVDPRTATTTFTSSFRF